MQYSLSRILFCSILNVNQTYEIRLTVFFWLCLKNHIDSTVAISHASDEYLDYQRLLNDI